MIFNRPIQRSITGVNGRYSSVRLEVFDNRGYVIYVDRYPAYELAGFTQDEIARLTKRAQANLSDGRRLKNIIANFGIAGEPEVILFEYKYDTILTRLSRMCRII